MNQIEPGSRYRHYKHRDHEYEIIGIANHSETLEKMVIYRALYNSPDFGPNAIWARPMDMFLGKVVVDGKEINRFERI